MDKLPELPSARKPLVAGFVTIHRDAINHPLFRNDSARLGAWLWMLLTACWKPTRFDISGKTVTLERGQFCASRSQLARQWGWSQSAVERFLTRLETEQMIGRATGQGRSIITICNYSKYQDISEQAGQATGQATGQAPDRHRTAKEQGNKETIYLEAKASSCRGRFVLPDDIPAEPWEGFEEMRKRIKAPLTDRARNGIVCKLRELAEAGNNPGDVLDQSTMQSWRGVFEVKTRQSAKPSFHATPDKSGFNDEMSARIQRKYGTSS